MATASRVLGDQVGSTAPAFLAILAVHVIAGLTAVITGAIAALARKGSPRHIRAGRWYYVAITAVFATAAGLAVMRWSQDYYLLIVGAVAFTAATLGYLHRRRRRPGDTGHIAGMGIAYTAMLTAFYVDNGPHLPLWDRLPTLAFWLLPSAVAAPIITRALIRAKKSQTCQLLKPGASTAGPQQTTGDYGIRLTSGSGRSGGDQSALSTHRAAVPRRLGARIGLFQHLAQRRYGRGAFCTAVLALVQAARYSRDRARGGERIPAIDQQRW